MPMTPGDLPRYKATIDALVPTYSPTTQVNQVIIGRQAFEIDSNVALYGAPRWMLLGQRTADRVWIPCVATATDGSQVPAGFLASYIDGENTHTAGTQITCSVIVHDVYNPARFSEQCIDSSWGVNMLSRVAAVMPTLRNLGLFPAAAADLGASGTLGTVNTALPGYTEVSTTLSGNQCLYVQRDIAVEMIVTSGVLLILPTRTAAWLINVGLAVAV